MPEYKDSVLLRPEIIAHFNLDGDYGDMTSPESMSGGTIKSLTDFSLIVSAFPGNLNMKMGLVKSNTGGMMSSTPVVLESIPGGIRATIGGFFSTNHIFRSPKDPSIADQVAVTWDEETLRLYLNGVMVSEKRVTSFLSSLVTEGQVNIQFGKGETFYIEPVKNISRFSIYNQALTAEKIRRDFYSLPENAGLSGNNFNGIWSDNDVEIVIPDETDNGNIPVALPGASIDTPWDLQVPAQYSTTFVGYPVGSQPHDWTKNPEDNGEWKIVESNPDINETRVITGNRVLRRTGGSPANVDKMLIWDVTQGSYNHEIIMRVRSQAIPGTITPFGAVAMKTGGGSITGRTVADGRDQIVYAGESSEITESGTLGTAWYWVRLSVSGTEESITSKEFTVKYKRWTGLISAEPTEWTITSSASYNFGTGAAGIYSRASNYWIEIDYFGVGVNGAMAPYLPLTGGLDPIPVIPPSPPIIRNTGPPIVSLVVSKVKSPILKTITATITFGHEAFNYTFYKYVDGVPEVIKSVTASILNSVSFDVEDLEDVGEYGVVVLDLLGRAAQSTRLFITPGPFDNNYDYSVDTLDDLLSLTTHSVGDRILMKGRYSVEDGGGGIFVVTNDAQVPDDGLIFAPYSSQSQEFMEEWTPLSTTHDLVNVTTGQNVVQGSYRIEVADKFGNFFMEFPYEMLHGHVQMSRFYLEPKVDIYSNKWMDTRQHFIGYIGRSTYVAPGLLNPYLNPPHIPTGAPCSPTTGTGAVLDQADCFVNDNGRKGRGRIKMFYKATTNNIRFVRQWTGDTLNVRWFGAKTITEDSTFNNQSPIAYAINVGNRLNATTPGSVKNIYLPNVGDVSTTYPYFGSIVLGEGMTIRGDHGAFLDTASRVLTDANYHHLDDGTYTVSPDINYVVDGSTITINYKPVRIHPKATRMRVIANEAIRWIRILLPAWDSDKAEEYNYNALGIAPTVIAPGTNVRVAGIENLYLDGNDSEAGLNSIGGEKVFDEAFYNTYFRNSPSYSGFVATNHGNVKIPIDQRLTIRNVAMKGYGSQALLGNGNNNWVGENVRLENTFGNHSYYSANGLWTNLTFAGYAWTHMIMSQGIFNNLVFEDNPVDPLPIWVRDWDYQGDVVNQRGADAYDYDEWIGMQELGFTDRLSYTDPSIRRPNIDITVDGFYMDLSEGGNMKSPMAGIGPNITTKNGLIIMNDNRTTSRLFSRAGNVIYAMNRNNVYKDVTIVVPNGTVANTPKMENIFGPMYVSESYIRNLKFVNAQSNTDFLNNASTLIYTRSFKGSTGRWSNTLRTTVPNVYPSWRNTKEFVYDNVDLSHVKIMFIFRAQTGILADDTSDTATPSRYFVLNTIVNNVTNTLTQGEGGLGRTYMGQGRLLSVYRPDALHLIQVYWRDSQFNVYGTGLNHQIFLATNFFDNVRDGPAGRTSENNGVYTSGVGDEGKNYVLFPLGLFYVPHVDAPPPVISSPISGLITGYSYTDVSGNVLGNPLAVEPVSAMKDPYLKVSLSRPLGVGETVAFTWSAAVRPWPAGIVVPSWYVPE